MIYKKYFKRLGDIVASTIALLLLSPIFIIISLLLLIVNDGKPFFTQKRPGNLKIQINE